MGFLVKKVSLNLPITAKIAIDKQSMGKDLGSLENEEIKWKKQAKQKPNTHPTHSFYFSWIMELTTPGEVASSYLIKE